MDAACKLADIADQRHRDDAENRKIDAGRESLPSQAPHRLPKPIA